MGLIHLDSGVIIGFLDAEDAHHRTARTVLADALRAGDRLALAASALAECLVGPSRTGTQAVQLVRTVIDRLPASVIDLNADIASNAAWLRARHRSLRLPDALVIATASVCGADRLVTTDGRWPSAKAMKLSVRIDRI
jgi:predicted nucleic acid-binding protein